jgi:hypothetical protein
MNTGTPAEASVGLYNELIGIPHHEIERIRQIEWRLRALHRRSPSDPRISVAFLQASLMAGNAQEAVTLAKTIWSRRDTLPMTVQQTFLAQLVDLGFFEQVLEACLPLLSNGAATDGVPALVAQAMLGMGDIDWLRGLRGTATGPFVGQATRFVSQLDREHLAAHLPEHQERVRSVLSRRATSYEARILDSEGGAVELVNFYYVAAGRHERLELEEQVNASLNSLWSDVGLEAEAHVPTLTTVVLDLAARPPHRSLARQAA